MTDSMNVQEFSAMFAGIGDQVAAMDYSDTLDEFMPVIAEQHASMFGSEQDSNGSPWAELRPSTIARKGHDRILFETGALRDSLVSVGGPNNIAEAFPRGLVFGTSDEKALFHQDGTSRMPARPPVGLSEETLGKLVDRVADATVEKLKQ